MRLSENPYTAHADVLRADYGAAIRLQRLVLHLWNAQEWHCDMAYLMRSTDDAHRGIALAFLNWYHLHGENCPMFMETARELSKLYVRQP